VERVAGIDAVLREHEAAGRRFSAAGVDSCVLRSGSGEPVVLMHGVSASSFLYRKVVPILADRGFDAMSFDLPGLGLADRSPDLDYSIGGVLVLRRPRIVGSGLRWSVTDVHGWLLRESGACVLVVDPPEHESTGCPSTG